MTTILASRSTHLVRPENLRPPRNRPRWLAHCVLLAAPLTAEHNKRIPQSSLVLDKTTFSSSNPVSFYTVSRFTDELLRIDLSGSVQVIGPIGSDVDDVDMAVLGGTLYLADSHNGQYVDLVTVDTGTGAEQSRIRMTYQSVPITNAEGMAVLGGQLLVAWGPAFQSCNVGTVDPGTGILTLAADLCPFGADMDGLEADPLGNLVAADVDGGRSNVYNVQLLPPSYYFDSGYVEPRINDFVFLSSGRMFAVDDISSRLYELDLTTDQIMSSVDLAGAPSAVGLALGDSAQPIVLSVFPDHGLKTGSGGVMISGLHFTGATDVSFGDTGVSFVVDNDSQIMANLGPATSAGWVDVRVTTPQGSCTLTDGFDYFIPPQSTFGACSTPRLTWSGYPTLGQNYTVTTQNLGMNNQILLVDWTCCVISGRGNSAAGGPPSIGHWTQVACLFYPNPDFQIVLGNTPSYTIAIPGDPAIIGLKLVTQAVVYSTPTVTTDILAAQIGE